MQLRALILCVFIVIRVSADPLGDNAEVTPSPGWVLVKNAKPALLPTWQYAPSDGRNATVLISVLPAGRLGVSNAATLREFNYKACKPYLPTPDAQVNPREMTLTSGLGLYVSFEDPSLAGQPPKKGDYKVATTASLYLGQDVLIHATILCDNVGTADFKQALDILKSVTVKSLPAAIAPVKPAPLATSPGRTFVVRPPEGFAAANLKANDAPGYFSYVRADGVMLTGWLDQAAKFKGMRTFWASEKASLENNTGIKIANESFKIVGGWNVVSYDVAVGAVLQQNIRACRVYGGTWVDVHLSQTGAEASQRNLEAVLGAIKVEPVN